MYKVLAFAIITALIVALKLYFGGIPQYTADPVIAAKERRLDSCFSRIDPFEFQIVELTSETGLYKPVTESNAAILRENSCEFIDLIQALVNQEKAIRQSKFTLTPKSFIKVGDIYPAFIIIDDYAFFLLPSAVNQIPRVDYVATKLQTN